MKRRAEKHKEIAERMVAVRERSTAKREARKKLQSEKRERGNAKDRESVLVRVIMLTQFGSVHTISFSSSVCLSSLCAIAYACAL